MKNKRYFKIFLMIALISFGIAAVFFTVLQPGAGGGADGPFKPLDLPSEAVTPFANLFGTATRATEYKTLPAQSFQTLEGKKQDFTDFKGTPTLVNFWATWCPPCVVELPALQKLEKYYEGRLKVVAIALEPGKPSESLAEFLDNRQIGDFAAYQDVSGALTADLKLRGLPTTYLLGSEGEILYRFEGDADWTSPEAKAFFDAFLLQKR